MKRWLSEPYGIFEMIVASLAFLWGVRAILPWGNIFFFGETRFQAMASILPAWVWGGAAVGLALWLVVSSVLLTIRHLRWVSLVALCGFFLFMTLVYFLSDPRSVVMLPYLHFAALCAALLWMQRRIGA